MLRSQDFAAVVEEPVEHPDAKESSSSQAIGMQAALQAPQSQLALTPPGPPDLVTLPHPIFHELFQCHRSSGHFSR